MTNPTVDFGDNLPWRKSRRSADQGGNCVCVAAGIAMGVRDSKEGAPGVPQWYDRREWSAFLVAVKSGRLGR